MRYTVRRAPAAAAGGGAAQASNNPAPVDAAPPGAPHEVHVMHHEGATRIVHRPDGTIECLPVFADHAATPDMFFPAPEDAAMPVFSDSYKPVDTSRQAIAYGVLGVMYPVMTAAAAMVPIGACMGVVGGASMALHARASGRVLQRGVVVREVSAAVRGMVLGGVTGMVVAPVALMFELARLAVRPAVVGLGVHAARRWVRRHALSAERLLRQMSSGDVAARLEALRRIVARLATGLAFTKQFKRLGGIEAVLKALEAALAAAEASLDPSATPLPSVSSARITALPTAALAAAAVAQLATDPQSAEELVSLGGVPLLVRAMAAGHAAAAATAEQQLSSSPVAASNAGNKSGSLLVYSSAALARLTAQLEPARDALVGESGAAGLVVGVLGAATERRVSGATQEACDELRGYAVSLCQVLAMEPAGKGELGAAGGVDALSAALVMSAPWTVGQAAAAAALHALVRGDPDNQRRLAAVAPAGLSAAIHRSLATGAAAAASAAAASPTAGGGGGSCGGSSASGAPGASNGGSNNGGGGLARFFRCDKGATTDAAVAVAGSWGCLTKPLPVEEHATHRGELLALNHVIARHVTPAVAAVAPVAAPAPSSAPAPSTSVLQRLQRLRMRRAAPVPARGGVALPKAASPARPSSPAGAGAGTRAPTSGVASEAGLLQADAAAVLSRVAASEGVVVPRSPSDDGVRVERSLSGSADLDWESDMGSPTRATAITKGSAGACVVADDRGGSDVSSGTEALLTAALTEPLAMRALPAAAAASSGSRA